MKLIPVVMCGGSGTRLWPLSRKNHPKQFAPLFDKDGEDTLFRRTMDRVARLESQRSIVVCNRAHRFFVAGGLHERERRACTILVEPHQRGTAPAATLAALEARREFGDALLLIMPSDHAIADPEVFAGAVDAAAQSARENCIVMFGIKPARAETDYGYIRTAPGTAAGTNNAALKVVEFCEKPDQETAAAWIARGDCYWNSGIFLLKASVYLDAIAQFEPGIGRACEQALEKRYDDLGFIHVEADSFAECRDISIDYAVMERADNLLLLPADMGWNDLGGWHALAGAFAADAHDNRIRGDAICKDATGNIIYAQDRLVGVLGVDDCIVVDTPDAVLVAAGKHAPDIKHLVADLRAQQRPEADEPRKVLRPWGYYESVNQGDNFQVKRIVVSPGQGLSLQLHHHRSEHWVVVKGKARVTKGDDVFTLAENESTYIPAKTRHRLENVYDEPVFLIEVQCGDYLGEDDIERFDDRYGRAGEV